MRGRSRTPAKAMQDASVPEREEAASNDGFEVWGLHTLEVEADAMRAGIGFTGARVGELLDSAAKAAKDKLPAVITADNGTEFTSKALDAWGFGRAANETVQVVNDQGMAVPISLDRDLIFRSDVFSQNEIEEIASSPGAQRERQQKECEEQRKPWRREEEERRHKEQEAARVKHIQEAMASWRMARDIRAYVAEIHALVKEADLKITEGAGPDQELKWALTYADRIDPLTSWRKDLETVKAKLATDACPDYGKVHGAEADADQGDDAGVPSQSGDSSGTEPGPGVA